VYTYSQLKFGEPKITFEETLPLLGFLKIHLDAWSILQEIIIECVHVYNQNLNIAIEYGYAYLNTWQMSEMTNMKLQRYHYISLL